MIIHRMSTSGEECITSINGFASHVRKYGEHTSLRGTPHTPLALSASEKLPFYLPTSALAFLEFPPPVGPPILPHTARKRRRHMT